MASTNVSFGDARENQVIFITEEDMKEYRKYEKMGEYSVLILFIQMFCLPKFAECIRNDLLHPKTEVMRTKAMFGVEMIGMLGFCVMMAATFSNLDLSNGMVVSACYVYMVINVIVQIVLWKREGDNVESSRCFYFKIAWLVGVVLHFACLLVALQDFQDDFVWKTMAGVFYVFYGMGYFFVIYFSEKDVMNFAWGMYKKETAGMESEKNGLEPLRKMDGEEYRQCKIKEVRKRNGLATLGFCLMAGVITVAMLIMAEGRAVKLPVGLFYGGMFVLGTGMFIFLWRSAEKNVKTMKFYAVYEGVAQVIATNPLTVQYVKADGNTVLKQVGLQIRRAIPAGAFVKIIIEDNKIVKITRESGMMISNGMQKSTARPEKQGTRSGKQMVQVEKPMVRPKRKRLDNKTSAFVIIMAILVILLELWLGEVLS